MAYNTANTLYPGYHSVITCFKKETLYTLSRQEISFLRRYSLKRPYPLKKETLALNSTISPVPGETKYDGFGPFSRFFRPRAPPRPRATPATGPPPPPGPGTVARRPGRARAARGGSPRGEKGPFFQLLGLGLANKCPKRRRRRAPPRRRSPPPRGASQMRVFGAQGVHKTRRRRRHCLCRGLDRARDPGS